MILSFLFAALIVFNFQGSRSQYGNHKDIGFTARKAIIQDGKYIGYKDLVADINVGQNYFNLRYGFFRTERTGMYTFSFQAVSSLDTEFTISLRVNGVPKVFGQAQRGFQSGGNTATLYLYDGDVVYLYLEPGSVLYEPESYRGYTTFSGRRITYNAPELVAPRVSTTVSEEEEKDLDDKYNTKVTWKK